MLSTRFRCPIHEAYVRSAPASPSPLGSELYEEQRGEGSDSIAVGFGLSYCWSLSSMAENQENGVVRTLRREARKHIQTKAPCPRVFSTIRPV